MAAKPCPVPRLRVEWFRVLLLNIELTLFQKTLNIHASSVSTNRR